MRQKRGRKGENIYFGTALVDFGNVNHIPHVQQWSARDGLRTKYMFVVPYMFVCSIMVFILNSHSHLYERPPFYPLRIHISQAIFYLILLTSLLLTTISDGQGYSFPDGIGMSFRTLYLINHFMIIPGCIQSTSPEGSPSIQRFNASRRKIY